MSPPKPGQLRHAGGDHAAERRHARPPPAEAHADRAHLRVGDAEDDLLARHPGDAVRRQGIAPGAVRVRVAAHVGGDHARAVRGRAAAPVRDDRDRPEPQVALGRQQLRLAVLDVVDRPAALVEHGARLGRERDHARRVERGHPPVEPRREALRAVAGVGDRRGGIAPARERHRGDDAGHDEREAREQRRAAPGGPGPRGAGLRGEVAEEVIARRAARGQQQRPDRRAALGRCRERGEGLLAEVERRHPHPAPCGVGHLAAPLRPGQHLVRRGRERAVGLARREHRRDRLGRDVGGHRPVARPRDQVLEQRGERVEAAGDEGVAHAPSVAPQCREAEIRRAADASDFGLAHYPRRARMFSRT